VALCVTLIVAAYGAGLLFATPLVFFYAQYYPREEWIETIRRTLPIMVGMCVPVGLVWAMLLTATVPMCAPSIPRRILFRRVLPALLLWALVYQWFNDDRFPPGSAVFRVFYWLPHAIFLTGLLAIRHEAKRRASADGDCALCGRPLPLEDAA
jgi:hypothetical protein